MGRSRSSAALLPPGLIIEQVRIEDGGVAAVARSRDVGSACPGCGKLSRRVHSRYMRSLPIFRRMAGACGSRSPCGGSGAGTTAAHGGSLPSGSATTSSLPILTGVSGGSTFAIAMQVADRAEPGSVILCMLPDTGERYLSTPLFEPFGANMNEAEAEISRSTLGYQMT